jgi:hypothetical protein
MTKRIKHSFNNRIIMMAAAEKAETMIIPGNSAKTGAIPYTDSEISGV